MSVLGFESGYMVKYGLRPWEIQYMQISLIYNVRIIGHNSEYDVYVGKIASNRRFLLPAILVYGNLFICSGRLANTM